MNPHLLNKNVVTLICVCSDFIEICLKRLCFMIQIRYICQLSTMEEFYLAGS